MKEFKWKKPSNILKKKMRLEKAAMHKLARLRLEESAAELIEHYNLERCPFGKRFLGHELQRALLKSIRNRRKTDAENRALALLEKAVTIEYELWQTKPKEMNPISALKVLNAAVFIAEKAVKAGLGKNLEKEIAELNQQIKEITREISEREQMQSLIRGTEHAVEINAEKIMPFARLADKLVGLELSKMPELSFFVSRGIYKIGTIINSHFNRAGEYNND